MRGATEMQRIVNEKESLALCKTELGRVHLCVEEEGVR